MNFYQRITNALANNAVSPGEALRIRIRGALALQGISLGKFVPGTDNRILITLDNFQEPSAGNFP